jgi:tripartite-type tricarboxylate transporter receptor subunit TctC
MVMKKRIFVLTISVAGMFFLLAGAAGAAEKYPNRPINMIVGFAPGGASDLGSKIVADRMPEFLGQPLTPVYKPGGGGALSASFVARAKPDGYTTLVMVSFMNLPPEAKSLDYKLDDFILTGMWGRAPYFILVKADSRWKTLKDLVEEAKKNPGKLSFGSTGTTAGGTLVYNLLAKYSGAKMTYVPFKSCGEVMTALMGGHIDAYFCVGAGGATESALMRNLACAEEKRLDGLENIPTIAELGWPAKFSTWYTFAFPKGTPKEVVDRFSTAQQKAIEKYSREISEGLRRVDMWPIFMDREATVKEFQNQYEVIRMIMKEAGPAAKQP